ncbi:PfkB family carbohydrate kinase [Mycobacterium sp. shizuoka-1]|uniref:PfkB family carbohydrate kinase n=1 Tax=Mycobacterium sp. shizuoka-1 TaxID=2039281 RepID=UPI000C05E423|nr:PfkB family carbohydrate kinase [Mycobacterium sp. shizuoka-1]GAY15456.1 ribokinase [Mycobacterium sp. shizuoka-1]
MARVCVVGSVNVDQFFSVAVLPRPGETVLSSSHRTEPGGKGGNQAVAAARAGADVQFVGAVGTDPAGTGLRAHLAANGVGLDGLEESSAPSGSAVIVVDDRGENTIVVAAGANGHLSMASAAARAAIADCEVLLAQLEVPIATVVAAAREARAVGATVIVNASPVSSDPGLSELAALTDVVILNETEEAHWDWPTTHVVVTRGAHGASYRGPHGAVDVPSPAVEAIDTTGAGDVFAGVLAAEWASGHQRALRRAAAAGALATLVPGAGDCAPVREAIDDALTRY